MAKKKKDWIKKAVNPKHHGDLHKALGVPLDQPIPMDKLEKAAHSNDPHLRHMAEFALNMRHDPKKD